jgi:2-polyprenyl-3-methyl-5-hydroxy-6-metoxy-1,4-benzoquinol methylase
MPPSANIPADAAIALAPPADLPDVYADAPLLQRLLVRARPWICPLEPLLEAVPRQATVLEVGCGVGLWLVRLAERRHIAGGVGCDINPRAIAVAQAAARRLPGGSLRFEAQTSACAIPPGQFDCVMLIDVLHHVAPADQPACVAEAASRVAPGGVLIYKDMVARPWWRAGFNRLHDLVLARQWIHYVPTRDVAAWARATGLRITRFSAFTRFAYGHEMMVFERPAGPAARSPAGRAPAR